MPGHPTNPMFAPDSDSLSTRDLWLHSLVEVAVWVDAERRDSAASRFDVALSRRQPKVRQDDAVVPNADVAWHTVDRCRDQRTADDKIERS